MIHVYGIFWGHNMLIKFACLFKNGIMLMLGHNILA